MLDKKDHQILKELQLNSKLTTQQISKKTLIPITTIHNRIKRLEKEGIIQGYTVTLDHKKLGFDILAFILLTVRHYISEGKAVTEEGMAKEIGIIGYLNNQHWDVINFIRGFFIETGRCPVVYWTCKVNNLRLRNLKDLFPSGYLRGACKLAGITYIEGYLNYKWYESTPEKVKKEKEDKVYRVDVRGFLINPAEWDREFALHRAYDMKLKDGLKEKHWQIIDYLREYHHKNGSVPTVIEACETNGFELDDLEELFPDGYHRGAIKLAGLRLL